MADENDLPQGDKLFAGVYTELRRLAAAQIRQERPGQSLSATGLVHEAFVKLVDPKDQRRWETRSHFFSAAAQAMRFILVDRARKRMALKRGGDNVRLELDLNDFDPSHEKLSDQRLIELNDAIEVLAKEFPVAAELVHLRFFAGMTFEEVGNCLEMSESAARRKWAFARAKLLKLMEGDSPSI